MPVIINVEESHPYFELAQVFEAAFNQASAGKGNERHAYGENERYCDQLICEMDRRLHGVGDGPRYQAVKKIYESARMDPDRAIKELLGAINYTAAAVIILKEKIKDDEQPKYDAPENDQKQKLYERFMEIQQNMLKAVEEKKEDHGCKSCPLNSAAEKKTEEKKNTDLDDLFDDNFGNDSMITSRIELGE